MKKLFLVLFLLLIAFIVVNRQRVYLRDPLAKVTRTGQPVSTVTVMINYANDVLLDDAGNPGQRRIYLLQHWNQKLETPIAPMKCLYALACLLDADHATATILNSGNSKAVTMSPTQVRFTDEHGEPETITLR